MNATAKSVALGALFVLGATAAPLAAQIPRLPDPPVDRRPFDFGLDDLRLRSEIATQRVARQAEVARLEARIEELESQLDDIQAGDRLAMWPFLNLIAATDPPHDATAGTRSADADAPDADEEPETATGDAALHTPQFSQRRLQLARLMAEDYLLAREADLVDAQIELVETSQSVASVERLLAKGLATNPQLEREQLERERAAVRVQRLKKQIDGLRELFPALGEPAAESLPAP